MAQLTADDIADLVKGTLKELGRGRFQQIAQDLQDYIVFRRMFAKERLQFDDGIGIQRNLLTSYQNGAGHVGLFNTDAVNVPDLMQTMSVSWVHAQVGWAYDVRELLMNTGESAIFNVVKARRAGAMIDMAETIEDACWSLPASTDTHLPKGIPYWIVKNATTGFNGGNPSGHSDVGGLDSSTYTKWKNYTAQYTNITKDDLIKKIKIACRKTAFRSPVPMDDYRKGVSDRYHLYVDNDDTIADIEDLGEGQNENLGPDLFSMYGRVVLKGFPFIPVPALDDDSQNPVYGIDHSTFYPVCLRGNYLREGDPIRVGDSHNVFRVHMDLSYNLLCVDRRRNFVMATA